jgi:glycosyltransferase involved in cell wall biosynthesis
MKIAFFTDSYKPYTSGVVRSIDLYTSKVREAGHEVFIFAPDYPEAKMEEGLYRFTSLPAITHPSFRLALPLSAKINKKIREIKPDIIHTHSPFLLGLLAKYMAGQLDVPLVFTYHTLYEKYAHYIPLGEDFIRSLSLKYVNNYCNKCDLIITPSKFVSNKLTNYNINTPRITIPTGINLDLYRERRGDLLRKKYDIGEKERVFLFVGRLGKEKNIELLLNSFQKINCQNDSTKFIIVGDGPERDNLENTTSELVITESVIFTGLKNYQEVVDYYLASDIFFFASPTETQGLVILEAMAGGLPVIAVNKAGAGIMVEDQVDGILVDNNEAEFVEAGIELLGDKERYNYLAKNALQKADEYSMENMTSKLLDTYNNIIQLDSSEMRYWA